MEAMITFIGWATITLGGAFLVFMVAIRISSYFWNEIEGLIPSVLASVIAAIAWVIFILWLSPMTITFN